MNKNEITPLWEPKVKKSPMLSPGEKQNCCCHCVGTTTREIYTQNSLLNTPDGEPNQLTSPIRNL